MDSPRLINKNYFWHNSNKTSFCPCCGSPHLYPYHSASQETSRCNVTGRDADGEVLRAPGHMHLDLWREMWNLFCNHSFQLSERSAWICSLLINKHFKAGIWISLFLVNWKSLFQQCYSNWKDTSLRSGSLLQGTDTQSVFKLSVQTLRLGYPYPSPK